MLNKKLVLATAFGAIAFGVTAFAGGSGEYAPAPSVAGLYLEGNVGYAWRDWEGMYYWKNWQDVHRQLSWTSNSKGGFAAIVDAGYQFNEYFSAEAGWIYMTPPKTQKPLKDHWFDFNNSNGSTWTFYFGGKIQAPIYDDKTFIFGKLAVAYNYTFYKDGYHHDEAWVQQHHKKYDNISRKYWSPLFAAGVQRYFTPNLSANIQYTFIPAATDAGSWCVDCVNVPQSHILTVGVGYKFLM